MLSDQSDGNLYETCTFAAFNLPVQDFDLELTPL